MRWIVGLTIALLVTCDPGTGVGKVVAVQCGQDLGLTAQDSMEFDGMGRVVQWEKTINGDTLVLHRGGLCGDECGFGDSLKLFGLSMGCPQYIAASHHEKDLYAGDSSMTAHNGTLRIQDWKPDSLVSGVLEAEVALKFWVRM